MKTVPTSIQEAVSTSESIETTLCETEGSFGFYIWTAPLRWADDDFSVKDKQALVRKLDSLRDEPAMTFASTSDALEHLRSLARHRK